MRKPPIFETPSDTKRVDRVCGERYISIEGKISDGYLTEREYHNFVRLFRFAADRVLAKHPQMKEEVNQMTEPLIKLPSVIEDELRAEIANQKAKLADKDVELKNKDAEIQRLQRLINQLSSNS